MSDPKKDVITIIRLSKHFKGYDFDTVEKIKARAEREEMFDSVYGERFVNRISEIAKKGSNAEDSGTADSTCILCRKNHADNGVVCPDCITRYGSATNIDSQKSNDKSVEKSNRRAKKNEKKEVAERKQDASEKRRLPEWVLLLILIVAFVLVGTFALVLFKDTLFGRFGKKAETTVTPVISDLDDIYKAKNANNIDGNAGNAFGHSSDEASNTSEESENRVVKPEAHDYTITIPADYALNDVGVVNEEGTKVECSVSNTPELNPMDSWNYYNENAMLPTPDSCVNTLKYITGESNSLSAVYTYSLSYDPKESQYFFSLYEGILMDVCGYTVSVEDDIVYVLNGEEIDAIITFGGDNNLGYCALIYVPVKK